MAETESSFYKRAAIDQSISSKNCSIVFKDVSLGLRQHRRQKIKTEESSQIDTSLVLVIALGVSTCCLVGFLVCVIAKFISDKNHRPVESTIRNDCVQLQRRENQQQKEELQTGPSSTLATVTRGSHEILMTESHFRNYDSV